MYTVSVPQYGHNSPVHHILYTIRYARLPLFVTVFPSPPGWLCRQPGENCRVAHPYRFRYKNTHGIMSRFQQTIVATACAAALALTSQSARAVIRVEFPVSRIYTDSRTVAVASVVTVNPANRLIDARVTKTFKGTMPDPRIRIQIAR